MTEVLEVGAALSAPFLRDLPVTGLSISVVSRRGAQSTLVASDPIATRLEELQFQLGEGPTSDALRSGAPVLAADLHDDGVGALWPVFTVAALDAGARGLFSIPLLIGPVTVGVVSMYALVLVPAWSARQVDTAIELAGAAARPAMELATRSAAAETSSVDAGPTEMRREVHQATGMVAVQLDCGVAEAMARLRAHAFAHDRPIDAVAREVVDGVLDLSRLDD